jgi:hypothetical protein
MYLIISQLALELVEDCPKLTNQFLVVVRLCPFSHHASIIQQPFMRSVRRATALRSLREHSCKALPAASAWRSAGRTQTRPVSTGNP